MYNYKDQITAFIKANFQPASIEKSNIKMTTNQLLDFLFLSFPQDCISDYDLNDIMLGLQYTRTSYIIESRNAKGKIIKSLAQGWLMISLLLD